MITDNLQTIHNNIGNRDVTIIAVSKKQPDIIIEDALAAGLRVFGENRVQEAATRWSDRKPHYPDLELHLIGPLQTNKVKQAVEIFDVIQTLDRDKLAVEIVKHKPDIPCFIQVNTGEEPQKSGVLPQDLKDFHAFCTQDLKMNIQGLMAIPPVDEPAGLHFGLLAEWRRRLRLRFLSMGMSSDYTLALQYGATHIRIGSALLGERP